MPKDTFVNLNETKKRRIVEAFLIEFSTKTYDEASISDVVRQTGIAKGSIYQYFDNKLDLFNFLITECGRAKMRFVGEIERENYKDFWSYFRVLYVHGSHFDEHYPLESNFLYSLWKNLQSPSTRELHDQMLLQRLEAFEAMIQYEVDQGFFKKEGVLRSKAYLLMKMGESVFEQLILLKIIDPEKSIKEKKPLFQGKEDQLLEVVDEYINLIKPAFDANG